MPGIARGPFELPLPPRITRLFNTIYWRGRDANSVRKVRAAARTAAHFSTPKLCAAPARAPSVQQCIYVCCAAWRKSQAANQRGKARWYRDLWRGSDWIFGAGRWKFFFVPPRGGVFSLIDLWAWKSFFKLAGKILCWRYMSRRSLVENCHFQWFFGEFMFMKYCSWRNYNNLWCFGLEIEISFFRRKVYELWKVRLIYSSVL